MTINPKDFDTTFTFRGKVVPGKKRGKKMGFPTANLPLHHKLAEGVYLSQTKVGGPASLASRRSGRQGGRWYNSLTFVGSARTFGEKDYKAEVFLLDFAKNITDQWLTVKLLKKWRRNRKFNTTHELKKAMEEDLAAARKFFKPR